MKAEGRVDSKLSRAWRNYNANSAFASTLCFPDSEKSCFACCPPIRPAGCGHIQYRNIIRRALRENARDYDSRGEGIAPITGFSCWALAYLDKDFRLVGCLLHPAGNRGVDLRYRTGYGEKCRRESCPEAKSFLELSRDERAFWLQLTSGLDSFAYSSKENNSLFKMMGWGAPLLRLIALHEQGKSFTSESFFQAYPFFSAGLNPRAGAYLLHRIIQGDAPHVLQERSFAEEFMDFSSRISGDVREAIRKDTDAPHTHLLGLDPYFLDFLRLGAGIRKIALEDAMRLKGIIDRALKELRCNAVQVRVK